MSNNEGSPAHHKPVHGFLYLLFRPRIHRTCSLIKDEHRSIFNHCPCYCKQLLLSCRETHIFIKYGVVALRQGFHIAVESYRFCSLPHFLICRLCLGIFYIVLNAALKEPGILKHHTEGLVHSRPLKPAYRGAVYDDFTLVKLVKLHKEVDKCGLARSCRPYYSYLFT